MAREQEKEQEIEIKIARIGNSKFDSESDRILEGARKQLKKSELVEFDTKVYESLSRDKLIKIAKTDSEGDQFEVRDKIKKILCNHMLDEISKKAGMGGNDKKMQEFLQEKREIISNWKPSLFGPSLTKLGVELNSTLKKLNGSAVERISEARTSVEKVTQAQRGSELKLNKDDTQKIAKAADLISEMPVAERGAIKPLTQSPHRRNDVTQNVASAAKDILKRDKPTLDVIKEACSELVTDVKTAISRPKQILHAQAPSNNKAVNPEELPTAKERSKARMENIRQRTDAYDNGVAQKSSAASLPQDPHAARTNSKSK